MLPRGKLREHALFVLRGKSFVEFENRFHPVLPSSTRHVVLNVRQPLVRFQMARTEELAADIASNRFRHSQKPHAEGSWSEYTGDFADKTPEDGFWLQEFRERQGLNARITVHSR